ncbi:MAG: hypothetical protein J6C64_03665 [Lachnospiraceae bacterium]|nr:hypothetical protein [Lachnospiraceae bacterium]
MRAGSGSMLIKGKGRKKKNDRGTSMITVVISFALLMIFVTGFFKVQRVSENMMMSARDLLVNNRELIKAYYLEETDNFAVAENIRLSFSGEAGGFYMDTTLYRAEKEGLTGTVYYYESGEGESASQ